MLGLGATFSITISQASLYRLALDHLGANHLGIPILPEGTKCYKHDWTQIYASLPCWQWLAIHSQIIFSRWLCLVKRIFLYWYWQTHKNWLLCLESAEQKQNKACPVFNCPPGGLLLTQPKHLPDAYRVLMACIQPFSETLASGRCFQRREQRLGDTSVLTSQCSPCCSIRIQDPSLPASCHKGSNL